MNYCLNNNCQHPQNPDDASVCLNCATPLRLQDRYRILNPIGQGGFGRTFLAVDEQNPHKQRCVVKQFFPQQQDNRQKASDLFRQEAEQLSRLGKHPQIPQLLAYFEQDDRQYLVQEFIDGRTLAEELAEEGPFHETQIRQLLKSLLPVLQLIHNHQLIHRDIKPENIIRRSTANSSLVEEAEEGDLVLVDFGAAKFTSQTLLGRTGTVIGSAAYTAPEQARGKAVFSSDLYSLAVTCIHLLTQVPPFDLVDSAEDTWVWQHYLKQPISRPLAQILDKMLQSATKRRYSSSAAILTDLNTRPVIASKSAPGKTVQWVGGLALAVTIGLGLQTFFLLALVGFRFFVPFGASSQTYASRQSSATRQYERSTDSTDSAVQWVSAPTTPGLHAQLPEGKQQILPLENTAVTAKVTGNVSRVEVTQTFRNPLNQPLEAVYVFPLPDEAAVDDMEITVGDRIIRGTIQERKKAQKMYQQAQKEGKTAALLEQERANIFTQSLANIKPGETIRVTIRYTDSLKFEQGDYEFVFPTVVGPRYRSGKQVGDAAKTSPPILKTGQGAGGADNASPGHDIDIAVEIEAGVPVVDVRSPSHKIRTTELGSKVRVQLDRGDKIPNKDLIVRYRVASSETQAAVLTQADERGGHFATYLIPAVDYQTDEIVPKDVVFLIDTSGSQSGAPMRQSKRLMQRFIQELNPYDTFAIINFSNSTSQLASEPLRNTKQNRAKAQAYIRGLQANGGTELLNGIQTVLQFPPAPDGRLRSIVLLTDGYIGDDEMIVAEVQKRLQPGNRLYSFGVGSSVNRFLVDRLAEVGQGTAEVVRHDEPIDEVVDRFLERVNNPVLTNVQVTWEGRGEAPEIYPLKPQDLFANQPLVLFGRKQDRQNGQLRITGIAAGGKRYEQTFAIDFGERKGNAAIAQLWGRARIKELMTQMFGNQTAEGVAAVKQTALAYRLLSKYTAFIAVTEEVRVEPGSGSESVKVPIAQPQGTVNANGHSTSIPEPSQVLALLTLGLYLIWKRRQRSTQTQPANHT